MSSISAPALPSPSTRFDPNLHCLSAFSNSNKFPSTSKQSSFSSLSFCSHPLSASHYLSRFPGSSICRCQNKSEGDSPSPSENLSINRRWDSAIHEVVSYTVEKFDEYLNLFRSQRKDAKAAVKSAGAVKGEMGKHGDGDVEWDWDRWKKHFSEVDEQERIVSVLKSQLVHAISMEDYEDAARLKVAIAAATNDDVGRVMSHLNKAIDEERYVDAAFIRDYAGAGLVGWWAGISEDKSDPYGRIIRISAEHGRYVARSYSPRQLSTAAAGAPVFEIFLTKNRKGEYKQQVVYLKRHKISPNLPFASTKSPVATGSLKSVDQAADKADLLERSVEDIEDGEDQDDDSDIAEEISGFDNMLGDMIPGVKVKVLKVNAPEKADGDLMSKVIEQIIDEEDEGNDTDIESLGEEDESKDKSEGEENENEMDSISGIVDGEEHIQIAIEVVVGGPSHKRSSTSIRKDLLRVPARLEKRGRLSFSFVVEKDDNQKDKGQFSSNNKAKLQGNLNVNSVMFDLAKVIGKRKIPMKVLKDVNELINSAINQDQNRQPLSGSTTFNRIEISETSDPLNGLYIGTHGLHASEVIHLRRKFGQWQEDGTKKPSNLEFYEFVEAVKLTGDPYVPAGQVAFRAKVGKQYQLPHKGIIPEEFGVVARYKGQGRLAEPGFQRPRWVDGELVILDGKYIKGGPVVGFLYWAPEFHFLVFFNRLRLQD